MIEKTGKTETVTIWIAGDGSLARQVCQEWVMCGACVSVSDVDYIYTMGAESGVRVDLINYPRFPSDGEALMSQAVDLAHVLMERLHQGSFTVQGPTNTVYFSRRSHVNAAN